jgi:nicotinate-nucleotide adenylyltransferase
VIPEKKKNFCMTKVGIFGGTFNPIHRGHLLAAETALEQVSLDRILWVPTFHSPYKKKSQSVSFHHRYQMVRLAIASHAQFVLPQFELIAATNDATYAIDILGVLQRNYDASEWYWILGLDAFQSLPRWVGRRELAPQCLWLVAPRWNTDLKQLEAKPFSPGNHMPTIAFDLLKLCCQEVAEQLEAEAIEVKWQLLQMPMMQISSSLVRQYCQQRRSIRYFVPEAVADYIATHRLYDEAVNAAQ